MSDRVQVGPRTRSREGREEVSEPLGLYVHIPFCETKCPYCDFNTYERIEHLIPAYVEALSREISLWGNALDHPGIDTVFFGGGTPSYLSAEYMAGLMSTIHREFDLSPSAEVTLEANPGDVSPRRLEALLEAGFNRLSIGVQSLDDRSSACWADDTMRGRQPRRSGRRSPWGSRTRAST